jgi:hypothetical protein
LKKAAALRKEEAELHDKLPEHFETDLESQKTASVETHTRQLGLWRCKDR